MFSLYEVLKELMFNMETSCAKISSSSSAGCCLCRMSFNHTLISRHPYYVFFFHACKLVPWFLCYFFGSVVVVWLCYELFLHFRRIVQDGEEARNVHLVFMYCCLLLFCWGEVLVFINTFALRLVFCVF